MHTFRHMAAAFGAVAASIVPSGASAAALSFDCDVPEAHSSSVGGQLGPGVLVTARITAVKLRPTKTPPVAGVLVTANGGRNALGIRVILPRPDAAALQVVLVGVNEGKPVQQVVKEIPLNGSANFALELDPAGIGRLAIDDKVIPTTFANMGLGKATAFCGSGQFRIDNLQFTTR